MSELEGLRADLARANEILMGYRVLRDDALRSMRTALIDIEMCCGYDPNHLGADSYSDPGIKLAQEIIEALRDRAAKALAGPEEANVQDK